MLHKSIFVEENTIYSVQDIYLLFFLSSENFASLHIHSPTPTTLDVRLCMYMY